MEPLEFFLPMVPPTVTAQEREVKVVGRKAIFYEPERLRDARAKLEAHLAGHAPDKPLSGPIRFINRWLYPIPYGSPHFNGEYKTTRPDTDNTVKLLKDCMTRTGFWIDDAQVCSELSEKFWADTPGIYIRVELIR